MRIRVKLDTTKLLACRKKIRIGDSDPIWVRLSYKKLSDFYYYCGIIGHGHYECEKWLVDKEKFEVLGLSYGQWLRAQIFGTRNNGSKQQ